MKYSVVKYVVIGIFGFYLSNSVVAAQEVCPDCGGTGVVTKYAPSEPDPDFAPYFRLSQFDPSQTNPKYPRVPKLITGPDVPISDEPEND